MVSRISGNAAQPLERFRELTRKIRQYEELLGVVYWDMRTGAPRKGIGHRSEAVGALSDEVFRLMVSDEMGELLAALTEEETLQGLGTVDRRLVEEMKKEYDRKKKSRRS